MCSGGESNLLSCQHNQIFEHNCQHYEDVAVICGSKSYQGLIVLLKVTAA